jgi:gamma-tubulin complex component 5
MHLTPDSQHSIISAFAHLATTLQHLRRFVSTVFTKATEWSKRDEVDKISYILNFRRRNSRTLEAFAEAVDFEVRKFDAWCSAREEEICHAQGPPALAKGPLVVSLLSLEKSVRDEFGTAFDALKKMLEDVTQKAFTSRSYHFAKSSVADHPVVPIWDLSEVQNNVPPMVITTHLLNALLGAVREQDLIGEIAVSEALMRVFSKSAEPVWSMIGGWIRDGMPIHDLSTLLAPAVHGNDGGKGAGGTDDEFFIEDNEMPLLDPDSWTEGCTLRKDGNGVSHVLPVFVQHVAQDVLSIGKAVGLLRALGGDPRAEDAGDAGVALVDVNFGWKGFEELIRESNSSGGKDKDATILPTSAEVLSRIVHEDLHPRYLSSQQALTKVLLEDCELEYHLNVMEDCYFMRRGDVMNHFLDSLFAKMDSQQAWFDFHFLNNAFRDVVEMSYHRWIDPSLVRLSYQDNPDNATTRSVRGLDPLFVEYAVPFPLTYVCGPKAIQSYSSIFVWLAQIKRARSLLENTVLRGPGFVSGDVHQQAEMKAFYALRNKLSWFVK